LGGGVAGERGRHHAFDRIEFADQRQDLAARRGQIRGQVNVTSFLSTSNGRLTFFGRPYNTGASKVES
jgi:hypothetical protein